MWFAFSPSWEFVSTRCLSNFGSPRFSLLTFWEGKKTWGPSYHKGVWTANGHLLWGLKGWWWHDTCPQLEQARCAMRWLFLAVIFVRAGIYIYIYIQKLFSNRCRFFWNGKHNVERNRRIWNDVTWKSSHPPCLKQLLAPGPILFGQISSRPKTRVFAPPKRVGNRNGNFPGYVREIQVGEILLYLMVKIDGMLIPNR